MMSTVKHEDRLVARGANPRTGLISPFVKIETTRSDYVGVVDDVFVVQPALPIHRQQHRPAPAAASTSTTSSKPLPQTTNSPPQHSRRTSSGGHWRANSASWGFVGPDIDVDPLKYDPVPGSNHVTAVPYEKRIDKELPQIYVEDLDDRPRKVSERRGHSRARGPEPVRIFEDRAVSHTVVRPTEPLVATTTTQQIIQQTSAMKIPRKQVGSASPPRQFQQPVGGVVTSGDLRSQSAPCWPPQTDGSGISIGSHGRPVSPAPRGPRVQDAHKNMMFGPKTVPPAWDAPHPPRGPRTARRTGPAPSPVAGQRLPRVRLQTHLGQQPPGLQPSGNLDGARKVPPSLRTGLEKRNAIEEMASFDHMNFRPSSPTRPNIRRREEQAVTMQEVAKPRSVENSPVAKVAQQLPVSRSNPDLRPIAPHLNGGTAGYRPPMQPRAGVKMAVETVPRSESPQTSSLPPRNTSPIAQPRPKEVVTRPRVEKPRVSFDVAPPEQIHVAPQPTVAQPEIKPAVERTDSREDASRKEERMSPNRDPVKRPVVNKPPPDPVMDKIVESPVIERSATEINIRKESISKPELRRRPSVVARAKHVSTLLHSLDKSWAASSAKWEHIRSLLWLLTCHVTSTLIHALVAVQVLTDPDKPMREYAIATRDVGLALTYLVALYQACRAALKLLAMLVGAVYYIWHPVVGIATVFRWFMVD